MSTPDYSTYSVKELEYIFHKMDRKSYPERYNMVCRELRKRGVLNTRNEFIRSAKADALRDKDYSSYTARAPKPRYDKKGNYIPNEISSGRRMVNISLAISIMSYGGFGFYSDKLVIPSRREPIVLTDDSLLIMLASFICAVIILLTEILDHYDKRDNEHQYFKIAKWAKRGAYILFSVAILNSFIYQ